MIRSPSVASVEFACVDFMCRLIFGTLVSTVFCQRMAPVFLSRA